MRADKKFKKTAYRSAATEINKQFGSEFTVENVENRMKTWRNRYFDMQKCYNLSGAGWDDVNKQITMDEDCFDRWLEDKSIASSKLREYINKPMKHFENLAIIIGNDQAKGDYAADVMDKFGGSSHFNIDEDEDDITTRGENTRSYVSLDDDDIPPPNDAPTASKPISASSEKQAKSDLSSMRKGKGRKTNEDTILMREIVNEVKQFTSSMREVNMHWTEKLGKAIFAHEADFSLEVLDKFYQELHKNESQARLFMGRPSVMQKKVLKDFMQSQQ